jgi:AcrR family transcriptional regulator
MESPAKQSNDRRIRRTQKLLQEALVSLIREKDYDSISIKEILDRANVGRSTFYTHFRDKDELFIRGIHEMLRSVQPPALPSSPKRHERILWFSLPIFQYHDHHRREPGVRIGSRGRAILHEHLQKALAELIADDARREFSLSRRAECGLAPDMLVQYVTSTFVLVLNRWLEKKSPLSPERINEVFLALVLPTLNAARERR